MSESEFYQYSSRDKSVVEVLVPGEVYTAKDLRRLYLDRTDIVSKHTAKRHLKQLVRHRDFERVGWGKWRYTGSDE